MGKRKKRRREPDAAHQMLFASLSFGDDSTAQNDLIRMLARGKATDQLAGHG
jgi:hypothetical protein